MTMSTVHFKLSTVHDICYEGGGGTISVCTASCELDTCFLHPNFHFLNSLPQTLLPPSTASYRPLTSFL